MVFPVVACCAPAGKSTLLVALLHFLLEQRSREGSPLAGARMLVRCGCFVGWGRMGCGCWHARRAAGIRLRRAIDAHPSGIPIRSAHTNVAVDRVLLGT